MATSGGGDDDGLCCSPPSPGAVDPDANAEDCGDGSSPLRLLPPLRDDEYYDDFSFASSRSSGASSDDEGDGGGGDHGDDGTSERRPLPHTVETAAAAAPLEKETIDASNLNNKSPSRSRGEHRRHTTRSRRMHAFAAFLPKIELHAHLNGSIPTSTLRSLASERNVTLSSRLLHECTKGGKGGGVGRRRGKYDTRPRSLHDCFEIFSHDIPLCVDDVSALRRITREVLRDFAKHHVAYLEVRSTPKRLLVDRRQRGGRDGGDGVDGGGGRRCSKREYVETILEVMKELEGEERRRYNDEMAAAATSADATKAGEGDDCDPHQRTPPWVRLPLVPRFIVSIDRSGTVGEAMEHAQLAIDLFRDEETNETANGNENEGRPCSSKYVVGVDLGGNPTKNDFRTFASALQFARDAGLKVTVHCGEVPCSPTDATDVEPAALRRACDEARAVAAFRPDRIGHALLLPPEVTSEYVLKSRVPVECCPTSNVMTLELATHHGGDLVEGLKRHPNLDRWLKAKHPMSVSTDDSGVFHTDPTRELLLLAKAYKLTEAELKRIVVESTEHVFERSGKARDALRNDVRRQADELMRRLGL